MRSALLILFITACTPFQMKIMSDFIEGEIRVVETLEADVEAQLQNVVIQPYQPQTEVSLQWA